MKKEKQYRKKILIAAGAAGALLAGTFGVLSLDGVQKEIAVSVLERAGIQAEFGEWKSHFFSEFSLRDVSLNRGKDFAIAIPELDLSVNLFSLIFTSDFSVSAKSGKPCSLQILGTPFSLALSEFSLSNLAGAKNHVTGTLIAQKGENPPQARFEFKSENRGAIRGNSLRAWFAGTRSAHLNFNGIECNLNEAGTWRIAESGSENPALCGSGHVNDDKFSGMLSVCLDGKALKDFGFFESVPDWRANAELTLNGNLETEACSVCQAFDIRFADPAGTFSGIPLFPEIVLSGKGDFRFSRETFSLDSFWAETAAIAKEARPVVFAKISVPEALSFSRNAEGLLRIRTEKTENALALLKFNNVPLTLANPFVAGKSVADSGDATELSGTLDGSFTLCQNDDGEFRFAGKEALKLRDFSLKKGKDVWISGISADLPVVAFMRGNTVCVDLKKVTAFGDDGTPVATADFRGTRDFLRGKNEIEATVRIESEALSQKFLPGFSRGLSDKKIAAESKLKAEIYEEQIDVSAFEFSIFEEGKNACALLEASTGAFRFDAGNPFVGLDGKRIALRANAFPLALLDPLARGKYFFAGTLDGEIGFTGEKRKVEFASDQDGVTIRDFYMKNARGLPVLSGLSLRSVENLVRVSRDESGRFRTEIGLKNARLKNDEDERLASGDLYLNFLGRELLTLRGNFSGELGKIVKQPLLFPVGNLDGGTFEVHGGWNAADETAKLEAACRDLRSRESPDVAIERVALKCEHNSGTDSGLAARIQIELDGDERSAVDVRFSKLNFGWRNRRGEFAADALAEKIVVSDFLRLAKILSPGKVMLPAVATQVIAATDSAPEPKECDANRKQTNVPASNTRKDSASHDAPPAKTGNDVPAVETVRVASASETITLPWEKFTGTLNFLVRELAIPENRFRDISGSMNLGKTRGELTLGCDNFFGGNLKGKTVLEIPESKNLCCLKSKVAVKDARIYEAIPALRTQDSSAIEGAFSLDFWGESTADSIAGLKDGISVKANLIGQNGRVRIFSVENKKMQTVGNLARLGGGMAELLGGFGGKKVKRLAKSVRRLQEYLSDFPFERHEISLSYKAGGPVLCEKFLLKNDLLKITGAGEIACREEIAVEDAPLAIRARMDVRGELEELLTTLGVLKSIEYVSDSGEKPYAVGPEFKFSGTLKHFSDNLLETLLSSGVGLKF